ncbi:MAG: glycosyltransferase family 39 protein [Candidatus Omnitrophica bacterium]|nr:glycosyltransferase family 39 protein [Candidatus Omnitrophota bacterium]
MKREFYVLTGILALTAVLHIYGTGWGVPDSDRAVLAAGADETVGELLPVMIGLHEEIAEMIPSYGRHYSPSYAPNEPVIVKSGGREIATDKSILNSLRSYFIRSYGADEQRAIIALSRIRPEQKKFNPHFYEYGGVYLYPMGLFFYGLSGLNIITLKSDMSFYFLNPEEMGRMYVWGRVFGAAGALLSVIVFFLLCRQLFADKRLAYFLTLLYGAAPGFVLWSHYLKPFSYGMLWFLLSLWAAVKFYREGKDKWLYFSAAFAGLSFGTLLSYGYSYWGICIFILFSGRGYGWKLKSFFLTFLVFLAVFFMTNPYVLLSFREFMQEIAYLTGYWKSEISLDSLRVFTFNTLRYGFGTPLWIALLAGIAGSLLYKPEKKDLLFFLLFLPGFLYFALKTAVWVHYSIFLYPLLIISTGLFFSRLRLKKILYVSLTVVSIFTALYSASYVKILGEKNTRTAAGEWINLNIPAGERIGLLEAPSPWRTPPFRFLDYKVAVVGEKEAIDREKPDYFIVSEYQWLRGKGFSAMEELLSGYAIIQKFEKESSFAGIRFSRPERVPHDWCHPNPVILIWKIKE